MLELFNVIWQNTSEMRKNSNERNHNGNARTRECKACFDMRTRKVLLLFETLFIVYISADQSYKIRRIIF